MLKKGLITILVLSIMSTGTVAFANEQDKVKEEMTVKKEELLDVKVERENIEKEIEVLDKEANENLMEVLKVEGELEELEENIDKNEKELKDAEEILEEKQENYDARLRVMYMNGDTSYLQLLLSSKNIKDFFSRQEMVKSIAEHDKKLLKEMKEQRDIIEENKVKLKAQRASLSASKSKLEREKKELEIATRNRQTLMSRVNRDMTKLEKEFENLNKINDKLDAEVKAQAQANNRALVNYSHDANVSGLMMWPVPSSKSVSSPFGYRIHPIFHTKRLHTGIDIPAASGSDVVAATDGKVVTVGWLGGYGNTVIIDHGGGITTLYAHNSAFTVNNGQSVKKGDVIAKIGSTGNSTGPHSHFEVRKNGDHIDPLPWVR